MKQKSSFAQSSAGSSEGELHDLWQSFAHSVRDNVIAEVAVQVLRLVGLVVLARALLPQDFGVFRILVVVSLLATLVNESGIPDALIQRKILTAAHESTAWYLSVALASICAIAMYLTAPLIARTMQMAELTAGIRLLCIPILLEGTAVTANARLRRALRFGALAVADVIGETGFLLVALAALWTGYPRASLAAGLAARFGFHALVVWVFDPYIPTTMPRVSAARDLARFSSSVMGGRGVSVVSSNADFLLVGRLLGSTALGFYSMAWDLLRFIPDRLYRVVGRVTLPAFCRLQDNNEQLARVYSDFFRHVSRILVPVVTCVAIAAPELIGTVYGAKWVPAALPLRLLTPGLILLGLRCGIGPIYYTKDHPSYDIVLHSARLVLIVLVVCATSRLGLAAVSTGMSAVEGAISVAGQWMACALIDLSITALCEEAWPGLLLAAMCGIATLAGRSLALGLQVQGPLLIAFAVLPPTLVFAWREGDVFREMLGTAFSSRKTAPVNLSEERA